MSLINVRTSAEHVKASARETAEYVLAIMLRGNAARCISSEHNKAQPNAALSPCFTCGITTHDVRAHFTWCEDPAKLRRMIASMLVGFGTSFEAIAAYSGCSYFAAAQYRTGTISVGS